LVELLIDRVIVMDSEVEIQYVIATSPASVQIRFCHLRKVYHEPQYGTRHGKPPGFETAEKVLQIHNL
jgi:hypothetical protein